MKIKITVPTDLSEITLEQYAKYLKLAEENQANPEAETFIALKMLEIFCNVPYRKAMDYRMTDVNRVIGRLAEMLNQKPKLVTRFTIGDTEFGFIPKLDDMTFGEYIDLDTNLSDWQKMYRAMAVLYRPIEAELGKQYKIKKYEPGKYEEAMKHAPMDAVFSSVLFFYHLGIELSNHILNYLDRPNNSLAQQQTSRENGVGIRQSIHSLKEMLQDLNISLENPSTNV